MASEGEIVLSYHDTLLRKSDVSLLGDRQWLGDNIISFWFEYLEHDLFKEACDSVTFVSPQVSQFIKSAAENASLRPDVLTSLGSMDLSKKKLILISINDQDTSAFSVGGTHWSLLIYIAKSKSFEHYDSLSGSTNAIEAKKVASIVQEALSLSGDVTISKAELAFSEIRCVQQNNGYDCGVHLIANAEALCRIVLGNETSHTSDIASAAAVKEMRKRLLDLIELLKQKRL